MTNILIAGSRRKWWPNPEQVAEFVDGMLDGFDLADGVLRFTERMIGSEHQLESEAIQTLRRALQPVERLL